MAVRVDLEPSQRSVKVRRPDELEISINWQKNGEVQTIIEDLIDAGWVVIRGQALLGAGLNDKSQASHRI